MPGPVAVCELENKFEPKGEEISSSAFEKFTSIGAEEDGTLPPRFNVMGSTVSRPPISTSASPPLDICCEEEGGGGAEELPPPFEPRCRPGFANIPRPRLSFASEISTILSSSRVKSGPPNPPATVSISWIVIGRSIFFVLIRSF
jgi:hypothetical protein